VVGYNSTEVDAMKWFSQNNYFRLMIIPFIFLVIFLFLAFVNPGISKGIDLRGGTNIIVHYDEQKDYHPIENQLKSYFKLKDLTVSEIKSPAGFGLILEFSGQPDIDKAKAEKAKINFETTNLDKLKQESKQLLQPLVDAGFLSNYDIISIDEANNREDIRENVTVALSLSESNFNSKIIDLLKSGLSLGDDAKIQTREITATLSSDFMKSAIKVGIIAFVLLVIIILISFRQIVPSGLIIFAALFDILAALAGMAVFNVPLSLTTIPALLMLIGYSVDTDILLSAKVLKNKSRDPIDSANESIRTGLTMTFTTMSALVIMLLVSYYTQMIVVMEIATILFCGLIGDLISTWFFNAPALIHFVNKRKVN